MKNAYSNRISIEAVIDRLLGAPLSELRSKWSAAHPGVAIPAGLPRDLIVRGILWSVQCKQFGDISTAVERKLDGLAHQLAVSGTLEIERSVRPKAGTRLIREWRGRTYVVDVSGVGFVHDGRHFASLSHIARVITGTRWSGPRFFGLQRQGASARDDG